jgi:hypothetical protein
MQCSELELVFEQEGLAPLSAQAREHLAECSACNHFLADVTTIVAMAHEFPAEIEPPERVWISIREQLQREGTIRGLSDSRATSPWWPSWAELFRNRGLAMASVGAMVIIVALLLFRTPRAPILEAHDDPFSSTVNVLSQQEHDLANMQLASTGSSISPVDASLKQNLQQVDEFIADCERRVKEEPSDELAREYLTNAYRQKAELLSVMMDRGGSLN